MITVTDNTRNVINLLKITSFTVSSSGWKLIARQVDSDDFTDSSHELFDSNAHKLSEESCS